MSIQYQYDKKFIERKRNYETWVNKILNFFSKGL